MKLIKKVWPLMATMLLFGCNQSEQTVNDFKIWLTTNPDNISTFKNNNTPLTKTDAQTAQTFLEQHQKQQLTKQLKTDWDKKAIHQNNHEMKFMYKIFGEKPANGRSLYISMHGGGGAPKAVNDQQWQNQIRLYTPKEGLYLAPRATTDTWDLWHQNHIDDMFDQIIQSAILFEDVNPNKVYVMGYSAGGDGTYQIAPRMADRWAAASMMAGHPGDASALNLRNIGFSVWMGQLDAAYKRNEIAAQWGKKLDQLQAQDPNGYKHQCHIVKNKGHWMERQDTIAVPWMATFTRNPYPNKIVWKQDNKLHPKLYWLSVDLNQTKKDDKIIIERNKNHFTILETNVKQFTIWLNDQMVDLNQNIHVTHNGKEIINKKIDRTIKALFESQKRFDPAMKFCASITIKL